MFRQFANFGLLLLVSKLVTSLPSKYPNSHYNDISEGQHPSSSSITGWSQAYSPRYQDLHDGYQYEDNCDHPIPITFETDESAQDFAARLAAYEAQHGDESDPEHLNEPDSPVFMNAFYPTSHKMRHIRFTDEAMKDLPIHPYDDTRRQFLLRHDRMPYEEDWEKMTTDINNELQKQRAFKHLKGKEGKLGFYYTPHDAVYYRLGSNPEKVSSAHWAGRLPILRKSKTNGSLQFTYPGDENHVLPEDDSPDGGVDENYTGEISDEDTEYLH